MKKFRVKEKDGRFEVQRRTFFLFWSTYKIATQCNAALWFLPNYVDASYSTQVEAEHKCRQYEEFGY